VLNGAESGAQALQHKITEKKNIREKNKKKGKNCRQRNKIIPKAQETRKRPILWRTKPPSPNPQKINNKKLRRVVTVGVNRGRIRGDSHDSTVKKKKKKKQPTAKTGRRWARPQPSSQLPSSRTEEKKTEKTSRGRVGEKKNWFRTTGAGKFQPFELGEGKSNE